MGLTTYINLKSKLFQLYSYLNKFIMVVNKNKRIKNVYIDFIYMNLVTDFHLVCIQSEYTIKYSKDCKEGGSTN